MCAARCVSVCIWLVGSFYGLYAYGGKYEERQRKENDIEHHTDVELSIILNFRFRVCVRYYLGWVSVCVCAFWNLYMHHTCKVSFSPLWTSISSFTHLHTVDKNNTNSEIRLLDTASMKGVGWRFFYSFFFFCSCMLQSHLSLQNLRAAKSFSSFSRVQSTL